MQIVRFFIVQILLKPAFRLPAVGRQCGSKPVAKRVTPQGKSPELSIVRLLESPFAPRKQRIRNFRRAKGDADLSGLAERLKFARQSMKLTLDDVESRTSVGASTLSEFENDKREPRLPQLKELADLFHRTTAFFLEEGPLPSEVVLWRQKPQSPNAEVLQAHLLRLAEQYHLLEQWCESFERLQIPFAAGQSDGFGYQQAEKLAHDFRNIHGLGERPGQSLLRVVEEICKIKVFHIAFEPSGSAACTLDATFGAAILLNSKNVRWRRNFDLAHELFHLLTWKIFRKPGEESFTEASALEENLATCFAHNLLMPQEPLLRGPADLKT